MIKINGMKITGLRKAVSEYNRYNAGGYYSPEYAELMFDTETGELWTDYSYSLGHNSWKEYHDPAVINIGRMIDGHITMESVKRYIAEHYAV